MERKGTRQPNPAVPYREDCWSEGETSALVDAWGDRYLELNRGNLRQKHWQDVADEVNSRRGTFGRRPPRNDVQCKNRIDTLKKKYKIEKARIAGGGGGATQWSFFSHLDTLIGSPAPAAGSPPGKRRPTSPPLALPLPSHRNGSSLPFAAAAAARPGGVKEKRRPAATAIDIDDTVFRRAAAAAAAAGYNDEVEEEEGYLDSPSGSSSRSSKGRRRTQARGGDEFRELARVIERFTEMYEKVERAKQEQMIELEKKRMEFAKEMEFQRMQILVDSQVQLAKVKRAKRSETDSYT